MSKLHHLYLSRIHPIYTAGGLIGAGQLKYACDSEIAAINMSLHMVTPNAYQPLGMPELKDNLGIFCPFSIMIR